MWDRTIIKSNAKVALRNRYWTAFAVCLLATVIMGSYSWITSRFQTEYREMAQNLRQNLEAIVAQSGLMNLIAIGSLLFLIFISLPITIGMYRFFLNNHFGRTDLNDLFSGFRKNYLGSVGSMLVTIIFIGLWSLLLLIPGIIKALEYSMVPFILADNPYIPGSRAREISRSMTKGEKGAIFVFILSFLGWIILASIPGAFIVAVFRGVLPAQWVLIQSIIVQLCTVFVMPYYNASFTELYLYLRDRSIQTGQINPAEFGLVPPPVTPPTAM